MFNSKKKKTQKNKTNAMQFPQTNAESIPYKKVYKNGIFEIEDGVYSKTYKLPPLNFKTASTDTQQRIAEAWSVFLGSLPDDVTREITIYNQTIDIMRFQENIMIPMKADSLNGYRAEYNNMLLEKMSGAKNNLEAVKFITLSLPADDIEKATERFAQIDHNVIDQVSQITKNAPTILSYLDRLELINAIYNQDSTTPLYQKRVFQGQEVESFSLENCKAQGINTKDVIAPSAITFERDYAILGNTYSRSYYISNFPTWVKGSLLTDLASLPKNMLVSAYLNTIPQDEAVKMIKRQSTNISSSIVDTQKRAAKSGFDASLISPDLQDAKEESKQLMDDMTKENAKLYIGSVIVTVFGATKDELEECDRLIKTVASTNLATIKPLYQQQETGLNTSLPLGNNQLELQRLMTSVTVSAIIPCGGCRICHKFFICYQ